MDLTGRVVLVTGASRGIGRALADVLAAEGARLVLCARGGEALGQAADALRRQGADVLAEVADVADDAAVERLVARGVEAFGAIDVAVNNAAILPDPAPVRVLSPEAWEATMRVNVLGTVHVIRHVLPGMEARGEGVIVNVSSGWGRVAEAEVAPYCASKFAVEALTRSVALETASGVIVFALNPGILDTAMLRTAWGEGARAYPSPEALAPRWRRLFRALDASWHGTSRDL